MYMVITFNPEVRSKRYFTLKLDYGRPLKSTPYWFDPCSSAAYRNGHSMFFDIIQPWIPEKQEDAEQNQCDIRIQHPKIN